jgi:transcriptional regulator of acetoin/glycerol metabolism
VEHDDAALALEGGNGARAAKRLGVHRNDVYKAMRKYGIKKGDGEA